MLDFADLEQVRAEGNHVLDQLKHLVHEGNIRRIVVTHDDGQVVAEFPLAFGVIGTMLAPVVAAIGAIMALIADCHIYVERFVLEEAHELAPSD